MNKIIKYYLYFLPFFSLTGIVLGTLRTAYHDSYSEAFLTVGAIIDLLIILYGFKHLFKRKIAIVFLLLIFSLIVGALNNEISRRFITDFTNPFFFFAKVYIFGQYWLSNNFNTYIKYYTRIAFAGSVLLLPITYFLFQSTGTTRLAIFPPMELPYANYMLSNSLWLLVSFIIIMLYGKRAQLFSAIITFLFYTFLFKRKQIFKYFIMLLISGGAVIFIFNNFSNNLAVIRLKGTFDLYNENHSGNDNLDKISAGRYNELETIINQMQLKDYFIGKGLGFVYLVDTGVAYAETTNAHFSPIGFLSKYGLLFTIYIYYFIISIFVKTNKKLLSSNAYVIALGVSVFVFLESFFAYAIFVTPILPIVMGVLIAIQKKQKLSSLIRQNVDVAAT
ncbi:hypothetical protein [Mucilaginibacter sp. OK098]|uniref:hypothetical protein n=1 Tax=Mucilaginibacter sp. OK098 TaxID=1855297 RepID=UPI00091E9D1A|nr:hypothetical protein [Mucilaginibacter sp. OK098]SHL93275.1 hypothetical protein SAMN05216524_101224 [Mucilaginibacter sp. OK098]